MLFLVGYSISYYSLSCRFWFLSIIVDNNSTGISLASPPGCDEAVMKLEEPDDELY